MTNSNPLLDKFYELYPEKKEEPKVIKAENPKNGFELKPEFLEQLAKLNPITSVTSNLTSPSVATSTTSITKASNTYTSHHIYDTEKTFLQIADKIKLGKANVGSMSIEHSSIFGSRITFEVMLYEP
jgi:hypothetical protein